LIYCCPFLPFFCSILRCMSSYTLFPYTTLFRSRLPITNVQQLPTADPYTHSVRLRAELEPTEVMPGEQVKVSVTASSGQSRVFRSEEHTSELQSRFDLVCRLLLDNKKT